ncbi:hypothetical protein [Phocaeicola vulgatus]|jgi:hypothetical protein|uniref:hypothetical protein n=1 Tax=Phocaeicola vulgatus TaxID=821 RepID=UPI0034A3C963
MDNNINNNVQLVPANIAPTVLSKIETISQSAENVEKALEAARKAKDSADAASKKSAGWSLTGKDKKEAIEALQNSGIELALGIQNIADAQKVMFDNLINITDATKYLFGLGVANIATTRVVIDTITSGLKDASKQKISQRAKESLLGVVQQLKAQEDLFNKIEKLSNKCKLLEKEIQTIKGTENAQSNELSLTGLTRKMLEDHNALLKQINTQTDSAKTEVLHEMKLYYNIKINEEIERTNNTYDKIGSASEAMAYTESLVDKVHTDSEKRLYEEKVLLEKKTSTLNLWCWILGIASIINLLISAFMFL